MIDIHAHILYGVDDGPSTLDEALKIIELAYNEGIRTIVATPHINHPQNYHQNQPIRVVFEKLKEEVSLIYPDLQLFLGCELYITSDFLRLFQDKNSLFTMAETGYILIEFDSLVDANVIFNTVHELKIRKYKPIIAHIERYPALVGHTAIVNELRQQGAYIQVTGSSIMGSKGTVIAEYLKKLIGLGYVDFIATDAHDTIKRVPMLKKVNLYLTHTFGYEVVKKLMIANPQNLLEDKEIGENPAPKNKANNILPKLNFVAAAITAVVVFAGTAFAFINREVPYSNADSTNSTQLTEDINGTVQTSVVSTFQCADDVSEEKDDNQTNIENETIIKPQIEGIQDESYAQGKSPDEVINTYLTQLQEKQTNYEGQVAVIAEQISIANNNINDETERKTIIEGYLDEVESLEGVVDNDVYHLLYDMQNELEDINADISSVQEFRDRYNKIKGDTKSYYIDKLTH